jgi:hypothetical protein
VEKNDVRLPLSCRDWFWPGLMVACGLFGFAAVATDVGFHGKLAQWDPVIAGYLHDHAVMPLVYVAAAMSAL